MINSGYNSMLTYFLADVYAWTIDFTRLDKGDRLKLYIPKSLLTIACQLESKKLKQPILSTEGKGFMLLNLFQKK